jgi:acetyl esterase/lipase
MSIMRFVRLLAVGPLLGAAILARMALAAPPVADVPYGPYPAERLDVCLPDGKPLAAAILIHGGGWWRFSKSNPIYVKLCGLFAKDGIAAFNIDYRLMDLSVRPPRDAWPAQLLDVQLAMRWVREHARAYGVEPARVCAWGVSAGGHLASFLAVTPDTAAGDASSDPAGEASQLTAWKSQPNCAVDASGVVDLVQYAAAVKTPFPRLFVSGLASYKTDPNLALKAASPLGFVSGRAVPTLIVQGSLDPVIDAQAQAHAFYDALHAAGVEVRYLEYRGGHAFAGVPEAELEALVAAQADFIASTTRHAAAGK